MPIPLCTHAFFDGLSSFFTRRTYNLIKPGHNNYVLALSYMDQFTWAATRLRSLQCWTSRWEGNYQVVEPFLIGTHLGAPVTNNNDAFDLKFSDAANLQIWNEHGSMQNLPPLANWKRFISQNSSRNVILVQIIYAKDGHCPENTFTSEVCNFKQLRTFFLQNLVPKSFKLLKEVCVDFQQGFLTHDQFNGLIFQDSPSNIPVAVVIDEWRGMYPGKSMNDYDGFVRLRDTECSPMTRENMDLAQHSLSLSERIVSMADDYISLHLSAKTGYTAVVIRWEKILLFDFYYGSEHYSGSECVRKIAHHLKKFSENGIDTTFLSTDVGRYGSTTFSLYSSTNASLSNVTRYTEELLKIIHGKPMTLGEYEKTFEDVSRSTNPTIISQLQKSVAARAECLVLVGWGSFQEHTLKMYQKHHKKDYYNKPIMIQKC